MAATQIEADAFQRLYPDQYYAKFIQRGVRPDGRPLALARPTSIALGAVHTADASALVKIGSTTVLAGVKCEVAPASADTPDEGRLVLQVLCRLGGEVAWQGEVAGWLAGSERS